MVSFLSKSHSKESDFRQPTLSRSRHALRSPLNSERLNLEASSFAYDIYKLYEEMDITQTRIDSNLETLFEGGDEFYLNDVYAQTSSIYTITNRLSALSNRLEILEKGLG